VNADAPCVWVVDDSAAIRETITVVLGDTCDVRTATTDEFRAHPTLAHEADLLILSGAATDFGTAPSGAHAPPVLWLLAPGRTEPPTGLPGTALSRDFSPTELRGRVQALLATPRQARSSAAGPERIDYPVFPHAVVHVARRAATTDLSVLICGEPGVGKARLARAIHLLRGEGRFVGLSAPQCTRAAMQEAARIASGSLTLLVSDVGDLARDGQHLLREVLDCGGFLSAAGWHPTRLICATTHTLEELAADACLDADLFYRLSVLPIALPPLRARADDVPALAAHVAQRLTGLLGTPEVTFTPRAMERLSRYLWFGNLAEFETVLTRSIALTSSGTLDVQDLLFGYGPIVSRQRTPAVPPTEHAASDAAAEEAVDLVINELAHEFKNPMVTIKTVAQHLERLLGDEKGREQVARLTGEAVDRMDRTLDNLLLFSSFRAPVRQEVALNTLVTAPLTDLAPTLSERRVVLDLRPLEPLPVFVDNQQIGYAFANLLRAIARDLPENQTLAVHPGGPGAVVQVEWTGNSHIATKLADFLDHKSNGHHTPLPIGVVFAKALIERNGGRLEIQSGPERSVITVWLPNREEALGDGEASNPSR